MDTPLLDPQGFPRADVDVVSVRQARVKIIELRNDYKLVMDRIGAALVMLHQSTASPSAPERSSADASASGILRVKIQFQMRQVTR